MHRLVSRYRHLHRCVRGRAAGFTLIELMIVVAIIGILAAIAIPNFLRFQAKARQSEVKSNLKAAFTAKKAVYSEKGFYVGSGFADYNPDKGNIYAYHAVGQDFKATAGSLAGTAPAPTCTAAVAESNPAAGSPGGFTINAVGNVDSDATQDEWFVNDSNCLSNGNTCTNSDACNDVTH
jgi:type IV pilus assembly protein PilA